MYTEINTITLLFIFSLSLISGDDMGYGAEWTDATFDQYPFMANLRRDGNDHCGGSIISIKNPSIILTAAHCITGYIVGDRLVSYDISTIRVWIGCTKSDCSDSGAQQYGISDYKIHEHYGNAAGANDIGLLFLDGPITHSRARTISLFPSNVPDGIHIRALGYYGQKVSDMDTLETHITQIIPNDQCNDEWVAMGLGGVQADTICVKDPDPIPVCGYDKVEENGLCYTPCKSGYRGDAFMCYETWCESGWTDNLQTCFKWGELVYWKKSYNRGAGTVPNWSETGNRYQGYGGGDSGSPAIYEVDGRTYQIGVVSGMQPDLYNEQPRPWLTQLLTSVPHFYNWIIPELNKYGFYGSEAGNYHSKLDDPRQFIYKICVRSGSLIDGIKFYYKTPKDDSYSDFILTESPFYGGNGGALRCYETDYIRHIYIFSGIYVNMLLFNLEEEGYFGESSTPGDVDAFIPSADGRSISLSYDDYYEGGVLRSVEVYDGIISSETDYVRDYINSLKFEFMEDGIANNMKDKMCQNGQISC